MMKSSAAGHRKTLWAVACRKFQQKFWPLELFHLHVLHHDLFHLHVLRHSLQL